MLVTSSKGLMSGLGFAVVLIFASVFGSPWALSLAMAQEGTDLTGVVESWDIPAAPTMQVVRSFEHEGAEALDVGPGRLVGRLMANGEAVDGVRLRLALDGQYWSPWVTTDEGGHYTVSLPYGSYRVDGYQFEPGRNSDRLLGLVFMPGDKFPDTLTRVDDSGPAAGPDLHFASPIERVQPPARMVVDQPLKLDWVPYPGAVEYGLQLWRSPGWGPCAENYGLMRGGKDLRVGSPPVDLHDLDFDLDLRVGDFYEFTVTAYGEEGEALSISTPTTVRRMKFQLVAGK